MNIAITPAITEGFVRVPLLSSDLLPDIIGEFEKFLLKDEEEKERYSVDYHHGDRDDGYVLRLGGIYDRKVFFHCRPHLPAFLKRKGVDCRDELYWFELCQKLFDRCESALYAFAETLSAECGTDMRALAKAAANCHCLRLLHYDVPTEPNGIIGKAHTDRNWYTIHVAESHSGLQFPPFKTMAEIKPDTGIIFPGRKAERFTQGRVKALPHQIIGNDTSQSRWSVVFFGHIEGPHTLEAN